LVYGMSIQLLMLVSFALGVGAVVKGATGLGLPIVAMPVLASFLGVPHAIAILALPIIVTNIWQVWQLRESRHRTPFLGPMLLLGAVGIVAGTFLLKILPSSWSSLFLGLMLAGYIALRLFSPSFVLSMDRGRRLAKPVGFVAGTVQGATGLSSPVGVPFIHAMRLSRDDLVFSVSAMFLAFSLVQLFSLIFAGLYEMRFFVEGLLALIPVTLMMPVGNWLGRVISPSAFDKLFIAILALIAANLIYSALSAIL